MQEVEHASQKRPSRADDFAGVVEEAHQRLQFLVRACPAVPPVTQECLQALQFICWEAELACLRVDLNPQEDQARSAAVALMVCDGDSE